MLELNELSTTLREQRLGSLEAGALLQRVDRGPVGGLCSLAGHSEDALAPFYQDLYDHLDRLSKVLKG